MLEVDWTWDKSLECWGGGGSKRNFPTAVKELVADAAVVLAARSCKDVPCIMNSFSSSRWEILLGASVWIAKNVCWLWQVILSSSKVGRLLKWVLPAVFRGDHLRLVVLRPLRQVMLFVVEYLGIIRLLWSFPFHIFRPFLDIVASVCWMSPMKYYHEGWSVCPSLTHTLSVCQYART